MYVTTIDIRDLADELDALKDQTEDELDDTDYARLHALNELQDELGADLRYYGENLEPTMIHESDFVNYAQELADDLGYMSGEQANSWPFTCIDWKRAADELRHDYTSVTFDGDEYLIRS